VVRRILLACLACTDVRYNCLFEIIVCQIDNSPFMSARVYTVNTVNKHEGKRPLERRRRRWVDAIKLNLN
jgi:hypothetical protein